MSQKFSDGCIFKIDYKVNIEWDKEVLYIEDKKILFFRAKHYLIFIGILKVFINFPR